MADKASGGAVRVAEGGAINYFNNNDPTDPHPAPGVADATYPDGSIDCTITLADGSTRQELAVNAPDPAVDYFRRWEPREELDLGL